MYNVIPFLWEQTVNVHVCEDDWVYLGIRYDRPATVCVSSGTSSAENDMKGWGADSTFYCIHYCCVSYNYMFT